jgi:sugar porter (SP) family MFS transporter
MNGTALRNAWVAALGGFLFGFDTAVISGVEQAIQTLWQLTDVAHGFTVSAALWGTVLGALAAGWPAEKFGRKRMLQVIGLLYLVTSLVTALTSSWPAFLLFRFLGGLGVGASSVVGPMYISEIAPAVRRGRLVALFQFNVVCGILVAFVSNYLLSDIGDEAWRWMLGVQAIPSLAFLLLVFRVPESPRWLIRQGREEAGLQVLASVGEENPPQALQNIRASLQQGENANQEALFARAYRKPVFYAVTLALFNQLAGINAIMYYAPRIFELTGLAKDASLLQAASIGLTNMVFTLLAISLIDKLGRKTLMIAGSLGMMASLGMVSYTFWMQDFGGVNVMVYLIAFIAFFALSQGSVIWVFISEIFPNQVRAKGQTLGSFTHWIMAALISWAFPVLVERFEMGGAYAFTFFAAMMALQLLFAWWVMPETRGRSLEQIQREMVLH